MRHLIYLGVIMVFLFSCKKEKNDTGLFSVSGNVLVADLSIEGAVVTVDNSLNWETTTDRNGNYSINGITPGTHTLTIKYTTNSNLKIASNNDHGYVEISRDISVFEDLVIENIKLPKPIKVFPISDSTESSMTIVWSSTDASDFREYKVFRHNSSGLDESTGELVHVSTSKNDTVFVDHGLSPLSIYYYRVYLMNEYGKLGGSNIVSSHTLEKNYIVNGDFEEGDDIFEYWPNMAGGGYFGTFGVISFCDSVKKNGNRSLYLYADQEIDTYGQLLTRAQILIGMTLDFDSKKSYKLSYWIKNSGSVSQDTEWDHSGYKDYVSGLIGDICSPGLIGITTTDTDWTYVEEIIPESYCGIMGIYIKTYSKHTWVDDLKLIDVPVK